MAGWPTTQGSCSFFDRCHLIVFGDEIDAPCVGSRRRPAGTVALSHREAILESITGCRGSLVIPFALFRRLRRGS